jgi:UDP-N-acetyl-D-glucosamine dehydrogenase
MQTEFIELAGEVNQRMPYFCVERIARALNDHSKSVRGSRVGIFGVSYKPGVGDLRESPLVVDFRGVTRGIEAPNLVRL